MGIFPDAQGQLTPESLVRSGRISNSSEILLMFLLPASMKKIRSKMKALEWTQHFPHYNPMGAICCHGNQSSNPTIGPVVAEIFEFENVYARTHGRTDALTNGRRIDRYTISSPLSLRLR